MIDEDLRDALRAIVAAWPKTENPPKPPAALTHIAPDSKAPGNLDAMSVRRACVDDLAEIAAHIAGWRHLKHTAIRRGDVGQLADFIELHIEWLVSDDGPGAKEAERITRTVNRHANKLDRIAKGLRVSRFYVWQCVEYDTDDEGRRTECPGSLYAVMRTTDDVLPPELICDHNSAHKWAAHQWLSLGRRLWQDAQRRAG